MYNNYFTFPFELKNTSPDGIIIGYASVFNQIDQHNDIIMAGAFKNSVELHNKERHIKFLWQHNSAEPIGYLLMVDEDSKGLYIEAKLLLNTQRGQEAYSLIKNGIVDGLSIGFQVKEYNFDYAQQVRVITQIDLWEISLVTFPANHHARITSVKTAEFNNHYLILAEALYRANNILTNNKYGVNHVNI